MKRTISVVLGSALALIVSVANADYIFGTPSVITTDVATSPSDSVDGLTLFVDAFYLPGLGDWDIWIFTRETIHDDWSGPVNPGAPINSSFIDGDPDISADGLTLFLNSNHPDRPGWLGDLDIYVSTRATIDDPWSEPVNLGPTINSPYVDEDMSVSADGLSLFFGSDRPGGQGDRDIYVSTRATTNDPWGEPENLGPIVNGPSWDSGPNISSDGLTLFFHSDRPGGEGGMDIWVTRRASTDGPWSEPVNLGPTINTPGRQITASISADGSILYFCSSTPSWHLTQVPIIPIVDFNADNRVDIEDLMILIEHWGTNESLCDIGPTPLGDGRVDAADLEVLMSHWGQDAHFLAHWKLDETGGDIAYDSAGGNHAAVVGDPIWQREGGQVEGALQFDGIDDCLVAPFILDPVRQPFSAYAWIKGGQPGQAIISQQGALGAWLSADSAGALGTGLTFPLPAFTSDVVITEDQWHHIGLVSDGSGMSLYVDEVEVARSDVSPILPANGDLQIGVGMNLEPDTFWSGMIDDVRVYDRVVIP